MRRHMPQSRCTPEERRERQTSSRFPHVQLHSKISSAICLRIVSRPNFRSLKDTAGPPRVPHRVTTQRQQRPVPRLAVPGRSEEHTSELQSRLHLVCRLLLEKKKKKHIIKNNNV